MYTIHNTVLRARSICVWTVQNVYVFMCTCSHSIKAYLLRSLSLRQGGILGLVYMAVSTDVTRGVSGVGGGPCECSLNVALPPIPPHLYFGFYGCRLQTDDEKMCFLVFIVYFVPLVSVFLPSYSISADGLLLPRSSDFSELFTLIRLRYARPLDSVAIMATIQMLWTRAEPVGCVRNGLQ